MNGKSYSIVILLVQCVHLLFLYNIMVKLYKHLFYCIHY